MLCTTKCSNMWVVPCLLKWKCPRFCGYNGTGPLLRSTTWSSSTCPTTSRSVPLIHERVQIVVWCASVATFHLAPQAATSAGSLTFWRESASTAPVQGKALGGIPGRGGLVLTAGMPVGAGLSERAASELGLLPHTPVASAVMDAYAGWVGTAAAAPSVDQEARFTSLHDAQTRLVATAGSSTCYLYSKRSGRARTRRLGPIPTCCVPTSLDERR